LITFFKRSIGIYYEVEPVKIVKMSAYELGCRPRDQFTVISGDLLNVQITSNITSFTSEKRFEKSLTVQELKAKLELICGASSGAMTITVFDKDNKKFCVLEDGNALFGSFPVDDGMRLHVEDSSKSKGEFENVNSVEKFELDKEEYSKRSDTVQAYLKKNKLGKYNEEEMAALAKEKEQREEEEKRIVSEKGIVEGARAQVTIQGAGGVRRGTVRFVGSVHFQPGTWVGVEYDEPLGKNDGSVGGQRYFTCQQKYGGFVKPNTVEVGDFPEEDLDLSDGEM